MKYICFLFAFPVLLLVGGCGNSCENVQCGYNEICANGSCYCNDGYYGQDCSQLSAEKFVNQNYYVTEYCQSGSGVGVGYYAYIYQGSTTGTILISNFLGQGYEITAYLKGDASKTGNYIYIPSQTYSGSGTVEGEGYYNPTIGRITFNLNYTFGFGSNSCTQYFQRQ